MSTDVHRVNPSSIPSLNAKKIITPFISHRFAGENLKGSTVTARACLMGANLIDVGGL